VIINGKPATKGTVTFDPSNYKRKDAALRTTPLKNDGTYEIKTLVGLNTVKVTGPAAEAAGTAYVNMQYDVPAEGGTYNIELPPRQGSGAPRPGHHPVNRTGPRPAGRLGARSGHAGPGSEGVGRDSLTTVARADGPPDGLGDRILGGTDRAIGVEDVDD